MGIDNQIKNEEKAFKKEYPALTRFFSDSNFREECKKAYSDYLKRMREIDLSLRSPVIIDARTGREYNN